MTKPETKIVFAIFEGLTQLDFTGPYETLARLPGAQCLSASRDGGIIRADTKIAFAETLALSSIPACDVLCIPGGPGVDAATRDEAFLGEIRRLAASARYVTSVCTGSLILGAAGLLRGKRATTHWAWKECLPLFGAIATDGRVVRDGDILTGGGVTAGIDFALTLAAELQGEAVARAIQLSLEYAPAPPFAAGTPHEAGEDLVKALAPRFAPRIAAFKQAHSGG